MRRLQTVWVADTVPVGFRPHPYACIFHVFARFFPHIFNYSEQRLSQNRAGQNALGEGLLYVYLPLKTMRPIYRTGLQLPSRCCILYIFSTNISTQYFKHAAQSPFFSSKCRLFHNATFFGSCIIQILHTECAKI
jgi:hypothetical protein